MRIAIMQPMYLPWTGYFALMDQVDAFVFLDDVQFNHRSWQQRNRIKSPSGPIWLTVPVRTKGHREQLIHEVEINSDEPWQRKHVKAISNNYSKAQWIPEYQARLEETLQYPWASLCDLTISLINDLARFLGIQTSTIHASELKTTGKKVSKLINICQRLGADEYLSPIGSFAYIEADNRFPDAGIRLLYQNYEHPTYRQLYGGFVSHLSIVDLLLNEGSHSLEIIRAGERTPQTSEEMRESWGKRQ
jgi:hypothetical protein